MSTGAKPHGFAVRYPERYWQRLVSRFWAKVDTSPGQGPRGDCWEWQGWRNTSPGSEYGRMSDKRRSTGNNGAHRISYEIHLGPVPNGLQVLHRCDNPPCVNPRHLTVGTQKDNVQQMLARSRHVALLGERNGRAKLTAEQVLEIRQHKGGLKHFRTRFGVSESIVTQIRSGKVWRHLP